MVNGAMLRDSIISAANAVAEHKYELNEINVFPVPDGDTGANMAVTMGIAKQMVKRLPDSCTVGEAANEAAAAMLRGSRGNSGAILALLFRGFARGLSGKETCGAAELTAALKLGVEAAYAGVIKPTEGTILTAAKECVARAEIYLRRKPSVSAYDLWDFLAYVAKETLKKTPELLDVLLEEEVVDAGAKGFLHILEGMTFAFGGNGIWPESEMCDSEGRNEAFVFMEENVTGEIEGEILVTYRASFDVKTDERVSVDWLRNAISEIGSSAVVVEQDGVARCQAFVDDLKTVFLLARDTGQMFWFLGAAHALTRKVQFRTPEIGNDNKNANLRYPYCTEFLILKDAARSVNMDELRRFLGEIGDSVVTAEDDDIIKCHVHTDAPEKILEKMLSGGYITELKIENMKMQA